MRWAGYFSSETSALSGSGCGGCKGAGCGCASPRLNGGCLTASTDCGCGGARTTESASATAVLGNLEKTLVLKPSQHFEGIVLASEASFGRDTSEGYLRGGLVEKSAPDCDPREVIDIRLVGVAIRQLESGDQARMNQQVAETVMQAMIALSFGGYTHVLASVVDAAHLEGTQYRLVDSPAQRAVKVVREMLGKMELLRRDGQSLGMVPPPVLRYLLVDVQREACGEDNARACWALCRGTAIRVAHEEWKGGSRGDLFATTHELCHAAWGVHLNPRASIGGRWALEAAADAMTIQLLFPLASPLLPPSVDELGYDRRLWSFRDPMKEAGDAYRMWPLFLWFSFVHGMGRNNGVCVSFFGPFLQAFTQRHLEHPEHEFLALDASLRDMELGDLRSQYLAAVRYYTGLPAYRNFFLLAADVNSISLRRVQPVEVGIDRSARVSFRRRRGRMANTVVYSYTTHSVKVPVVGDVQCVWARVERVSRSSRLELVLWADDGRMVGEGTWTAIRVRDSFAHFSLAGVATEDDHAVDDVDVVLEATRSCDEPPGFGIDRPQVKEVPIVPPEFEAFFPAGRIVATGPSPGPMCRAQVARPDVYRVTWDVSGAGYDVETEELEFGAYAIRLASPPPYRLRPPAQRGTRFDEIEYAYEIAGSVHVRVTAFLVDRATGRSVAAQVSALSFCNTASGSFVWVPNGQDPPSGNC